MRGPPGRGASRAEEEGARRRSGLIASFGLGSRNTAFPVHRPSDISSGANQTPPMVFTNHVIRLFPDHGLYGFWGHETRNTAFRATPSPANGFHETRILFSKHGFFRPFGRCSSPTIASPGTAARTAYPSAKSMLFSPLLLILYCKLLRTSAQRGYGEVHRSASHPPFSVGLMTSALRSSSGRPGSPWEKSRRRRGGLLWSLGAE